jgi:hypothetical protein
VGGKGGGWGLEGEMTQALYAHMNNKTIKKKKQRHTMEKRKKRKENKVESRSNEMTSE